MGQYYKIVNLDKKQFLEPHAFDEGRKLIEFTYSSGSIMQALGLLLADGNGRGSGDADDHPLIGTWAGDRIVIAGDYANNGKWTEDPNKNLYSETDDLYEDISHRALDMLRKT